VYCQRRACEALGLDKLEESHARERARNPSYELVLLCELEFNGCLTRRVTVFFYRSKGTVYIAWVTAMSTPLS
jgi:hypothetical protein